MTTVSNVTTSPATQERWLTNYYFARGAFSVLWVVAALTLGRTSPLAAAALLLLYPAWDAVANYLDAARSGGLNFNKSQMFNVIASSVVTIAVAITLGMSMNWVLGVFGLWAILSGLLQLATAIRRWKKAGGQWVMVLSGGQSALAGGFFIFQASTPVTPSIANVAGYAGLGAFYFLVSAVWLTVSRIRRNRAGSKNAPSFS